MSLLEENVKNLTNRATEAEEKVRNALNKKIEESDHSSSIEELEAKIVEMQRKIRNARGELSRKDITIEEYRSAALKLVSRNL